MTMIQADILEWARTYDGPKFHALLCDPPYHLTNVSPGRVGCDDCGRVLGGQDGNPSTCPRCDGALSRKASTERGFMGKTWDGGDIAFQPATWAAVAQHLYPGAWGMVFASSRGWHRLAVAIEDAGLIIQPSIFGWNYSTGFPKATNISAQIDDRAFRAWLDAHPAERGQLDALRVQARLAPKAQRTAHLRAYQQARKAIKAAAGFAPVAGTKKQTGAKFKLTQEIMDNGGFNASDRDSFDQIAPATDMAATWAGHRYGGQNLKPALEPVIVFQKPYDGSPVENITSTGAGALWIDGGRIGTGDDKGWDIADRHIGGETASGIYGDGFERARADRSMGRWPANMVLVHHPSCERIGTRRVKGSRLDHECSTNGPHLNGLGTIHKTGQTDADGYETIDAWQCHPACPVARLGAQSGESNTGAWDGHRNTRKTSVVYEDRYESYDEPPRQGDTGTAARYFFQADWMLDRLESADPVSYIAKASRAEREAGLDPRQTALMRLMDEGGEDFEPTDDDVGALRDGGRGSRRFDTTTVDDGRDISIDNPYQRGETTRRNIHATVKPISLSRHLATLLLPPPAYGPRRLLVPFAGVASEMIGAMLAGWEEVTGIELEADHVAIANARLSYWQQRRWALLDPSQKLTIDSGAKAPAGQLDMFMEDDHAR